MFKQYKLKNYKFILIALVVILNTIGVALVGSASPGDQKKQIIGMVSGIIIMLLVSYIDYNFILRFSWLIYLGAIGLLGLVIVAGEQSKGAQRWFKIGGFQFQPSELVKILMILFLAYYFMRYEEKINSPRVLFGSFVLIGIPLALILAQPNLSTTIVLALVFAAMLFAAGLSYKIVVGVLAVCVPTFFIVLTLIIQDKFPFIHSYKLGRIMGWLYADKYPDIAYQQQNSIDFIFAVAGEEMGFVGTVTIIILLLFITIECIFIARKAKDAAGRLICCGMAALIGFQSIVNICVATGLLPNTGVTLPFVSYGLTSLWSLYIGIGLVLNVGLQPKKY